jgi:predicted outer membrane repeat protein
MSTRLNTVLAAACAAMFAVPALATTFIVPSGATPTIQSAMELANQNGDEIAVGPGIYQEQIDFLGKSVHLYSTNGTAVTFIDGQGVSGSLVTFATSEDQNAIVEGFTIRSATSSAVLIEGAGPTIMNCRLIGNSAGDGAALYVSNGTPQITDCVFRENTASNKGGAIYCSQSDVSFLRVDVLENTCTGTAGGGIHLSGGTIGFQDCSISNNDLLPSGTEDIHGGGIYSNCNLSINNCEISGNRIHKSWQGEYLNGGFALRGGGLYAEGTAIITNSIVQSNSLYGHVNNAGNTGYGGEIASSLCFGGGIYTGCSNFQAFECEISSNTSDSEGNGATWAWQNYYRYTYAQPLSKGGGIFLNSGANTITACTIQGNSSSHQGGNYQTGETGGYGGGMYINSGISPTITESSFIGNSATHGGDGLWSKGSATPFIITVQFTANGNEGIRSDSSTPVISDCLFNAHGIGLKTSGGAPLIPTVSQSLFCENSTDISGGWYDKGDNTFTDDCGADCNENGIPDGWDLLLGFASDCNANGVPDECDVDDGTESDCNGNGTPDSCDITNGTSADCDANGIPDECDTDCNGNGAPDACDIADGTSTDCDGSGVPDECETLADCNANGSPDACDLLDGIELDCNTNGVPDSCDIADGTSADCDANGIPDECDTDCNGNGTPDACDIADGTSTDCDESGTPDECENIDDCNDNGVNDACDIANGDSTDNNGNGVPDECECPGDVNADGFVNVNDLLAIIAAWGQVGGIEDLNEDGQVGVDDLLIVIANWGPCPN